MRQLAIGTTVVHRLIGVVVHLRLIREHYHWLIGGEELGQKGPIDQRSEECEVQVSGDVHYTQAFDPVTEEERTAHRLDQIEDREETRVHIKRLFGWTDNNNIQLVINH